MFKKLMTLAMLLGLSLSLTGLIGCSSEETTASEDNNTENQAENASEEPVVEEVDEEQIIEDEVIAYFNTIPESKYMVDAEALNEKVDSVFTLDIRSKEDYETGHIPGALSMPMNEIGLRLSEIPTEQEVVVVCYSGQTASQAAGLLRLTGIDSQILKGGLPSWEKAGLEFE